MKPRDIATWRERRAARRSDAAFYAGIEAMLAWNTRQLLELWHRHDGDGLLVRTESDTPITVELLSDG